MIHSAHRLLLAATHSIAAAIPQAQAAVVTDSIANHFVMEFVTVGNPGNVADTTGLPNPAGSVAYNYTMGRYEVSRDMVTSANNAGALGITMRDMTPLGGNGVNRPATGVSWNEAARFVNWLNTVQGFQPAYKFATQPGDVGYSSNENISLWVSGDAGFNAANPFRNTLAHYFLPSVDEWYKAAYFDPAAGGYWNYPTGSNSAPTRVGSGTSPGTAVYEQPGSQGPADVNQAGGLSPYGTMGMGGNVHEWMETESDLVNNSGSSSRGVRGGSWAQQLEQLRADDFNGAGPPMVDDYLIGFRVATVAAIPEPSPVLLLGAVMLITLVLRRWLAK